MWSLYPPPSYSKERKIVYESQIIVNLVTDFSSEPPRTQEVAGSIPARGTEICALVVNPSPQEKSANLCTFHFLNSLQLFRRVIPTSA